MKQELLLGSGEVLKPVLESNPHPVGTIVQLERIGYAIIEENGLLMVHD